MERNKTTRNSKMERSRSGEDVSSSNESDPERHMSDNSGSTKPETESNLKNVMVLLRRDVHKNDGKVYMPNAKEMTQLKRPEKEQYKTGIKLIWNMTEKNVDEELRRRFPILGNNGRLSCATAADKGTRLEFHNSQGKVWDGSKINRLVRGNRVLYVLFEETSESVFERPDCSPQLQTPTHEPMGKKSRKRRNDGSASAAVCKRTKECSATVVSSIGNSSFPMQLCRINGRQNGPQGHSSTTTTISQKNISSQNFFLDGLSKASGSQKCAIPVTYTCTRTSSTIGPGHQTQASGGILPSAYPPVSMSSSPNLNFSMQTSVQGCQSQSIVSRDPQIQYHFVQDDLTVGNNILTLSQQGNSIPVADQTELQKQIQTGLDQQHVLQNRNSLLPGTTQSAGSNAITLDSGNIWQRSVPAHQTVGSQWGPQASVPRQSQIGQGQSPSTCLVYNQGDNPISQETQTSGTSLTESEILHNDPSKQTAATADLPPISHESDSGLSSTRNNDVGVAIASNSADQSEDTSTLPEIFSSSEDGEEIWFEYQILIPCGVVKKIFPFSGPILEDIPFCITLTLMLPRNYRKLQFKANFEGIGAVPLDIETGNATLTGNITSHVAGKVKVIVEYEGSNGNSIGFTFFEFTKKNDQVILGELSEVKLGQSVIFNVLKNVLETIESSGSGIQEATPCGAGGTGVSNVTKRSYALPEKILTLLVYKAAEINGREFLEMVFNTSAGRVVFNYYRKSSTLPGDVARANGHIILGDFLEDVNERLSKEVCSEDSYETVNWLELKYAVEKKVCLPCTDDAQLVNSPDGNDNQSDYEADDEASLLPSPADTNASGGELEDSEHGDIGQISLNAVTNVALHPNQKGVDRAEGHFVTSAVMAVAGETSNAIELSSEGGTDSSAERQNQEPTDSMTRVLPCEMWYCDKPDQKEEEDDLKKPLDCNQEGAGPPNDHIVTSAVTIIARETPNSSEVGKNSSASRLIQGPVSGITKVPPYGDNEEREAGPFIVVEMGNTLRERNCDGKDQEEELKNVDKPPDLLETIGSIMERSLGKTTKRTEELKEMPRSQTASAEKSKQEGDAKDHGRTDTASFYSNRGVLHSELGETDKAKECYKRALEIQSKNLGPEHIDVATSCNNLGTLHRALGETDEAKDCYELALEIQLKKLGHKHVDVAKSYNNLGVLHSDLGETDKAKDCYKRALGIHLKNLGPKHVHVAGCYNNLGTLHRALGETDEAKDYYERALEIQLKNLGHEHVHVATSYNNLGVLHSALGETDKAKDYCKRALEIQLKNLGDEHVDVAKSYNNLGTLHRAQGETDEAKDYHKRALEIQLKKLGHEHVDVAKSYNNLGTLHSELGETDEAKDYFERALEIQLKKLGHKHVDVAESYNNLGVLHLALGETDEAKDCYKRALVIQLKKLGHEHVDVAKSYNNLGTLHSELGETDLAKKCYERALEIQLKKLGHEHVDVAKSYNNLGVLHLTLGETDEAKDCYKRALEIQQIKPGHEHVDVAKSYNNLGTLHSELGETDEAKDYYERALEIQQKMLGHEHVDVAKSYNNLGTLHSELGETDEAKDCYKRALEIQLKNLGPWHVATSYNNLGVFHRTLGGRDEAKYYFKRALEIHLKNLGHEHVDAAKSFNNLGVLHRTLGQTDLAKYCHKLALEIQLRKLGHEHINVAKSYNNLGTLHRALGEKDEAKDCYRRALEIQLKNLRPGHVDVAKSYNNLGTLHRALGEIDKAKDYYKRALEIQLKKVGHEHVDVATSYNNLGTLHRALGETDEAKDCYKRALEIQLKKVGHEHVDVAKSYNNLGTLCHALGETDEAKDCYKRALEIQQKKLGHEHVDVVKQKTAKQSGKHSELLFHARENLGRFNFPITFSIICAFDIQIL